MFKVGDKVRVVEEDSVFFGADGVVIEEGHGGDFAYYLRVTTSTLPKLGFDDHELELVEVAPVSDDERPAS